MGIGRSSAHGFTLIELLVVIAIIGILAALVLVALGNARTKARAARVKTGIAQLRVVAEDWFDSQTPPTYAGWQGHANYATLTTDIANQGGTVTASTGTATAFCVSSTLPGGGNFCQDATGRTSTAGACNTTTHVCP